MTIIKRLKLLFVKEELLPFFSNINDRYEDTNEWCKKKEWKVYDNIHKTLNVVEEAKKNEVENNTDTNWYMDRAVDVALKSFIVINK